MAGAVDAGGLNRGGAGLAAEQLSKAAERAEAAQGVERARLGQQLG